MNLRSHPTELAETLLDRSICAVQVAAVLADDHGVFSWGWNSVGDGFGEHAEAMCLRRANRKRVKDAIIYVAAKRHRNKKPVTARPCEACQGLIRKFGCHVIYRDQDGHWRHM